MLVAVPTATSVRMVLELHERTIEKASDLVVEANPKVVEVQKQCGRRWPRVEGHLADESREDQVVGSEGEDQYSASAHYSRVANACWFREGTKASMPVGPKRQRTPEKKAQERWSLAGVGKKKRAASNRKKKKR
ncbi:hypothetical protein BHE74_00016997 [Ensete ventricosum]|nr:hypothetical protein BHE74_00016997 [Ensete ventricosum]